MKTFNACLLSLFILGSAVATYAVSEPAIGFDRSGALHIGVLSDVGGAMKMNCEVTLEFYVKTHYWRIQRQLSNRGWESKLAAVNRDHDRTEVSGMVGFSKYKWNMARADAGKFKMNWAADTTESAKKYSALNEVGMILHMYPQDKVRLSIDGKRIDYIALAERKALPRGGSIKSILIEFPGGESFTISDLVGVSKWTMGGGSGGVYLAVQAQTTLGSDVRYGASIKIANGSLRHVDSQAFEFKNSHDGWFPIEAPKSLEFADSPSFNFADASGAVLDAPAGKHGFLQVRDGGFYFENSPNRVRLSGVTLVHSSKFPTKEESELMAQRVATMGCNVVRLHHLDYYLSGYGVFDRKTFDTSTENFDDELMDRMDYLIAQFKKNGVYIHLDGLTYRVFKSDDGVEYFDKLTFGLKGTAYLYDHEVLSRKQKEYLTKLWTHKNPYTGLSYKDDPVIVTTEIVNENDLYTHASLNNHFPPPYQKHIKGMFETWRQRLKLPSMELTTSPAFIHNRFRMETMREYYAVMYNHLREVGVRIPITGTNWLHPGTPLGVYAAHIDMDYTALHPYGAGEPFRQDPYGPQSRAGLMSLSKMVNKPVIHNEWNYGKNTAGITRAASILYQIALMSSAGHDASYLFALFHNSIKYDAQHINSLNVGWDPAVRALLPAATVMMIRGDMGEPAFEVVYTPPMEKVLHSDNASGITRDNFDELLNGFSRAAFGAAASVDFSNVRFSKPQTVVKQVNKPAGAANRKVVRGGSAEMDRLLPDPNAYPTASATGELVSHWKEGYYLVKTARSKWAVGYLPAKTPIDLGDGVSVELEDAQFACITITSLNDKSIADGDRLMVATVSHVEQPETYFDRNWSSPKNLKANGTILCRPVRAVLTLPAGNGYRTILAKDHNGGVASSGKVESVESGSKVPLNQQVLVYEVTSGE